MGGFLCFMIQHHAKKQLLFYFYSSVFLDNFPDNPYICSDQ